VHFVVDEMGHARSVRASGGPLPGIAGCVSNAFAGLRTRQRPDIGRVDVSLEVRFTPTPSGS
jgi:hypothetical protein